jgi:hypothetical protein
MNKLYALVMFLAFTGTAFAGGGHSMDSHKMGSSKSSNNVHFYGRLYLGYDRVKESNTAGGTVNGVRDDGMKSRIGLKFRENMGSMTLMGNVEYKFDIGDGTATSDSTTCSTAGKDCRTFELHIGNLGLMTGLGYFGAGTFESPYKTMGMYDHNMDTATAMNAHGATSKGSYGIAGTWEGSISYHGKMGPVEIAYIRGMSDKANSNVQEKDFAYGLTINAVTNLEFGFARTHDKSEGDGESNDKFFASYKVLPNLGAFYTKEEMSINGSNVFTNGEGDIDTFGLHYGMGNNDLQFVIANGNSLTDGQDYSTVSVSNRMNLSKATDFSIGFSRQGYDGDGSTNKHKRSIALGLTHKF